MVKIECLNSEELIEYTLKFHERITKKANHLVVRIKEYMIRYEVESHNPELNKLLKEIINFIKIEV